VLLRQLAIQSVLQNSVSVLSWHFDLQKRKLEEKAALHSIIISCYDHVLCFI
jgi:hypothetical protein